MQHGVHQFTDALQGIGCFRDGVCRGIGVNAARPTVVTRASSSRACTALDWATFHVWMMNQQSRWPLKAPPQAT